MGLGKKINLHLVCATSQVLLIVVMLSSPMDVGDTSSDIRANLYGQHCIFDMGLCFYKAVPKMWVHLYSIGFVPE